MMSFEKVKLIAFIITAVVALSLMTFVGVNLIQLEQQQAVAITVVPEAPPVIVVNKTTSFSEYVINREVYVGKQATLRGRLNSELQGTATAGKLFYYVADDSTHIYLQKLTAEQVPLFDNRIAVVTGVFRRTYTGIALDVTQIDLV